MTIVIISPSWHHQKYDFDPHTGLKLVGVIARLASNPLRPGYSRGCTARVSVILNIIINSSSTPSSSSSTLLSLIYLNLHPAQLHLCLRHWTTTMRVLQKMRKATCQSKDPTQKMERSKTPVTPVMKRQQTTQKRNCRRSKKRKMRFQPAISSLCPHIQESLSSAP